MDRKITEFLIQNFYGCVKFPSNKNKLNEIIPNISGETGVMIIRNTEEDLEVTHEYLNSYNVNDKVHLITSKDFIKDMDNLFSHYSLIFIDDFRIIL